MSLDLRPLAAVSAAELADLEKRMAEFYRHPPESDHAIANTAADQYTPDIQPFHCDLA